jgi:hypothetical protein
VLVAGQSFRAFSRGSELRLAGRLAHSACVPPAALDLEWRLTDGPLVPAWPAETARAGSALYLPPFSLAGGRRYEVTLSGRPRGAGGEGAGGTGGSSFAVALEVVSQPLVARIAGGDRRARAGAPLVLDAAGSDDPDRAPEPFDFFWECAPAPCFAAAPGALLRNAGVLTVPAEAVTPGLYEVRPPPVPTVPPT